MHSPIWPSKPKRRGPLNAIANSSRVTTSSDIDRLRTEFGIYHTTIQIEHAPRPCFVPVVDPSAALATATASEYTAVSP